MDLATPPDTHHLVKSFKPFKKMCQKRGWEIFAKYILPRLGNNAIGVSSIPLRAALSLLQFRKKGEAELLRSAFGKMLVLYLILLVLEDVLIIYCVRNSTFGNCCELFRRKAV